MHSVETRERLRRKGLAEVAIGVERKRLLAEELVVKELEVRERERSKSAALQLEEEERCPSLPSLLPLASLSRS